MCVCVCVHVCVTLSPASQAMGRQGHNQFQLRAMYLCACKCWASISGNICVSGVYLCACAREARHKEAGVSHRGCLSFATLQLYP